MTIFSFSFYVTEDIYKWSFLWQDQDQGFLRVDTDVLSAVGIRSTTQILITRLWHGMAYLISPGLLDRFLVSSGIPSSPLLVASSITAAWCAIFSFPLEAGSSVLATFLSGFLHSPTAAESSGLIFFFLVDFACSSASDWKKYEGEKHYETQPQA